jgi:hypothetical protein
MVEPNFTNKVKKRLRPSNKGKRNREVTTRHANSQHLTIKRINLKINNLSQRHICVQSNFGP